MSQPSGDSKFFAPSKKGEVHELRTELESGKEDRQVNAVKKIIAGMTVGKDVSVLFPNVVKCMVTNNIELKKLVYLYIMNYAKSKPDLAILAVNAFVTDTRHTNPLIRALAVRTMGCIRVQRITEYLCQPLHTCLKDSDPYVRKTAAVCVAKLWDISSDLVENQGFLDTLVDLLSDANPMVVANAVAALSEIQETTPKQILQVNSALLTKLLAAMNECTEWGQVFILNFLANYVPDDSREAESMADRITPRLQHANSAVVLAAVKVLIKYLDVIKSREVARGIAKKMAPPLVTLLSKEPEIQYVALRNINLIVQKRPSILQNEMKVFFCKYNDPIYVKMEKLELMIMLANDKNIDQMLLELKEYATEADVEFVRKSVRAIGRCAIKLDVAAERCIQVLLGLIESQVNYVVHEAIIVIKDIFRKYPGKYESIISTLCENLADDAIDEPEARAAMIWIIGEYSNRIDNADELLENFLDNFHDEPVEVQLQLLTASVKLFLHKPKKTKGIVQDALNMATRESENPDLRDRGFIYWRLLSTNPEAAKKVVLAQKPLISDSSLQLEAGLLNELVNHISTLASVYHKPPETFVSRLRRIQKVKEQQSDKGKEAVHQGIQEASGSAGPSHVAAAPVVVGGSSGGGGGGGGLMDDLLSLDMGPSQPAQQPPFASGGGYPQPAGGAMGDLLGLGGGYPQPQPASGGYPQPQPSSGYPQPGGLDFIGGGAPQAQAPVQAQAQAHLSMVVDAGTGGGMELQGGLARRNGVVVLDVALANRGGAPLSNFEVRFNKNTFNLTAPSGVIAIPGDVLNPGQSASGSVQLSPTGAAPPPGTPVSTHLEIAVRNSAGKVSFGKVPIAFSALLREDGKVEGQSYLSMWRQTSDANEFNQAVQVGMNGPDRVRSVLEANRIFFVAPAKSATGQDVNYFSMRTVNDVVLLLELTYSGNGAAQACIKSTDIALAPLLLSDLQRLLR